MAQISILRKANMMKQLQTNLIHFSVLLRKCGITLTVKLWTKSFMSFLKKKNFQCADAPSPTMKETIFTGT
eukprot:766989-Rhodomonas_salina.2